MQILNVQQKDFLNAAVVIFPKVIPVDVSQSDSIISKRLPELNENFPNLFPYVRLSKSDSQYRLIAKFHHALH